MNWKNWLTGLFWAALTGVGTGITMVVTDPEHYNFGNGGGKRLATVSFLFGLVAAAAYLKDSRPPSWKDSTPTLEEMKKGAGASAILLACALAVAGAVSMPACASTAPPPTKAAAVADNATKVQQSANVILHAAQQANAVVLPTTGRPLVSAEQLVAVALVVNKIGRLGVDLAHALEYYAATVKAGGDLTALRAVAQKSIIDIEDALADVGKAIPPGLLQTIDRAVTDIFFALNLVKGGFGL